MRASSGWTPSLTRRSTAAGWETRVVMAGETLGGIGVHGALPAPKTQAVMPLMGEHVARLAARSIGSGARAERELVLVDHRPHARPHMPGAARAAMKELT